MFAYIEGTVQDKDTQSIVLDVQGVGYELFVPLGTAQNAPQFGEKLRLHTHFYVREDAQRLYGFAHKNEKQLFEQMIAVSGIGPKVALAILSAIEPEAFAAAISSKDTVLLTKIPGIGKKTAERLLLEMGDKVKSQLSLLDSAMVAPKSDVHEDVLKALLSLGYKPQQAQKALSEVDATGKDVQNILKECLASVS